MNDCLSGKKVEVPIWEKLALTVREAAVYSGIGENRIRFIMEEQENDFVLCIGNRKLIKRKQFEEFISEAEAL